MNNPKQFKFRFGEQIGVWTPNGFLWRDIQSVEERERTPGVDIVFNEQRLAALKYTGDWPTDPRRRTRVRKRASKKGGRS